FFSSRRRHTRFSRDWSSDVCSSDLAEVYDTAEEIAVKAEALLAPHRNDGSHRIETSHGATDSYVSLVGPAAASVEFGHWLVYYGEPTQKFIQGLYILHRAAGLQAKANSARMRR